MNAVVAEKRERPLAPYMSAIQRSKDKFAQVAAETVNYDKESIFAMQALMKTDFAMQTANKNPQSVHLSMINVASTGLTLNPANGYAYLVPRDGAIVLDISYKGLIKIATDTGAVEWARADVVYEADSFVYKGPAAMPEHHADPFRRDRGEIVGVYCIAKTKSGDVLTEVMDREELEKIRGKSMAYAKKKSGPWVEWFAQMAKKAVIKRASKTWPYTERNERLAQAIEIANVSEGGYQLDDEGVVPAARIEDTRKQRCDDAVEQYAESLEVIRDAIAREDWHTMTETWGEIPQAAQMDLWLAPTKGGWFTTAERKCIKENIIRETAGENE